MYRLLFCILLLTFQLGSASFAAVIVKAKTTHYNVVGSTGKELYDSMRKRAPKIKNARSSNPSLGVVDISILPQNYETEYKRGYCRIVNVDLVISVNHTYPKWNAPNTAGSKTKAAWRNFSRVIVDFQGKYVRIAKSYARKLDRQLKALKKRTDGECSDKVFSVSKRMRALQNNYHRQIARHHDSVFGKRKQGISCAGQIVQCSVV